MNFQLLIKIKIVTRLFVFQVETRHPVNRLERQDAVRMPPAPRSMYVTPQERASYPAHLKGEYFPSQVRLPQKDVHHTNQPSRPVPIPVRMQTQPNTVIGGSNLNNVNTVRPSFTVGGDRVPPTQQSINQQQQRQQQQQQQQPVPKTDHVDSTGSTSEYHRLR